MGAILPDRARPSERPSRSVSEPNRASLSKSRAVNLSKVAKPALPPKQCSEAGGRLSGVKEGGAVGQSIQEHERPAQADGVQGQVSVRREQITGRRAGAGVGAVHSSCEAGNDRGAKGPQ